MIDRMITKNNFITNIATRVVKVSALIKAEINGITKVNESKHPNNNISKSCAINKIMPMIEI